MSRGRTENRIFVNTQAVADDAPTGTVNQTAAPDPLGVLAANHRTRRTRPRRDRRKPNTTPPKPARCATIGERFADVAELATAGRTATMLDRLVDDGTLTPGSARRRWPPTRAPISLARVLRQAEIAGHDPDHVLRDAVTSRDLGDARSLAS